nr:hypothetical protein [Sedimentibacter sp.]
MEGAIAIIYMAAGYWAVGKTIYANKIVVGTWNGIFLQKLTLGFVLGLVLIPVAIIKTCLASNK